MKSIVIQNMVCRQNDNSAANGIKDWAFYFLDSAGKPTSSDPLAQILSEASAKNMDVFVGLMYNDKINGANRELIDDSDRAVFQKRFDDDLEISNTNPTERKGQLEYANQIWNTYKSYPSFKGWYIPFEAWNFKWNFAWKTR